jgi:transposase InsO family protein
MRAYKQFPTIQVATSNLSKDAQKRLLWFDYYFSHNLNASLTCRYFGISRDTFYIWKKRFNPRYLQSLEFNTKTRRPRHLREMTTPQSVQRLIYLIRKEDPEKSKYEIQAELKDEGVMVGQSAIQHVINRYPELSNAQHLKHIRRHRVFKIARVKAAIELRERSLGSLVQIDTKYFSILGDKYYIFSAIDCKSRFGYIYAYSTISSKSAQAFLKRVREYFPFPIQAVNTDNGSEYLLNFHKEVEKWGIPHYFSNPHCPKQNGRVERLHQTVEYEYLNYQDLYPGLELLREQCLLFNEKYNYKRYHRSLGYKKPGEYVNMLMQQQKGAPLYGI